ncbi:hypothetical protein CIC12_29065 [Burkholderia sp. SG-MS1]|uniref:hypothetical protein n=1 Tax=Paraburkholderia sp. SG-MS1 TaxID=2023741 RepID=UPI001444FA69|nr:hypothetical protein [Paraburkholderia sp. SG-MS1]NKJ50702.1 hypothetical protein [Paraburkholderia sp. SG-MS1]
MRGTTISWTYIYDINVIGPINQKGLILPIYLHCPAGVRLEITTALDKDWNRHTEKGYADLAQWLECKEKAKREGKNVFSALIKMIKEVRRTCSASEVRAGNRGSGRSQTGMIFGGRRAQLSAA